MNALAPSVYTWLIVIIAAVIATLVSDRDRVVAGSGVVTAPPRRPGFVDVSMFLNILSRNDSASDRAAPRVRFGTSRAICAGKADEAKARRSPGAADTAAVDSSAVRAHPGKGVRRGDRAGHHRPSQRGPVDLLRSLRGQGGSPGEGDGPIQRGPQGTPAKGAERGRRIGPGGIRVQPRAIRACRRPPRRVPGHGRQAERPDPAASLPADPGRAGARGGESHGPPRGRDL